MRLPDDIWQVIKDYLRTDKNIDAGDAAREIIENNTDIYLFDGGAFVAAGNEFDLFVVPSRRGKWAIKREITAYLIKLQQLHGSIVVKINEKNNASLRLARFFGFKEISRKNGVIELETLPWVH